MKLNDNNTAVFWGSFDPPTLAHKAIILQMMTTFSRVLIIVNNSSAGKYFASATDRIRMLQAMLTEQQDKYTILIQADDHQNDYAALRTQFDNLYVVAGADAVQNWLLAHDVNELLQYDGLYIVARDPNIYLPIKNFANVFSMPVPLEYNKVSSTLVREHLLTNNIEPAVLQTLLDAKVLDYIIQQQLFRSRF